MLVRRLIHPLSLEVLHCRLLCSRSGSLRHSIRQLSPIITKFRIKGRKHPDQLSPGTALRAVLAWRYLTENDVKRVLDEVDKLRAILWKLSR